MKTILLTMASYLAFSTRVTTVKKVPPMSHTHFDYTLIFPAGLVPVLEEHCGHFEELVDQLIQSYGGPDRSFNFKEFSEVLDYLDDKLELEHDIKRLLFFEVANDDGQITKADFLQYIQEIQEAY